MQPPIKESNKPEPKSTNNILDRAEYPTLEELIARIPKGYKAKEFDWGKPRGKEVW